MAAGADQQRLNPEERANLVAFIDGELTEAESRSLTTKLTHSATARREVELLQKTWDALDSLPRPAVSEQFHERTLTYVRSLEVRAQGRYAPLIKWGATVFKAAVCVLIAGAGAASGFAVARHAWPSAEDRIIRDLSLAEHLDEYLEIGGFEFLDELKNSAEFGATTAP
jgi:anti-sigma factor RsiW